MRPESTSNARMPTDTIPTPLQTDGAAWLLPRAAYIHVPFCAHRCGYCDFATVAGQDERVDAYLDALEAEMAAILVEPKSVRYLFVGGGTPTYPDRRQLETLFGRINHWFDPDSLEEFTVESNPNTLDADKVNVLADHGVNRVSLGAQSFRPDLLQRLERNHDPASVPRAVDLVRRRIDNVSLDLIFGVPGQTVSQWRDDLDRMLALAPDHCSTYGLTYEKGTPLWRQRQLGVVRPVDEESERLMFETAIDRLTAAGWAHYEISNFAAPIAGRHRPCAHNLVYWANEAYFGFGLGAAAYVGGTRSLNTRNLEAYIDRCRAGRSPVTQAETLEPMPRARETAMLHLRRLSGLERVRFRQQTGFAIDDLAGSAITEFVEMGFLVDNGRSIRLTREGLPVADGVLQSML